MALYSSFRSVPGIYLGLRPVSKELQQVAKDELYEDVDRIPEDLRYIKDWISKQPHLKARTDDNWLVTFLRGCKYSLERMKEKLDYFYAVRGMVPEVFRNRDPFLPEIQGALKLGYCFPLPKLKSAKSPRVIFCRQHVEIKQVSFYRIFMMTIDTLLNQDDNTTIIGATVVYDASHISMNLLARTPMDIANKLLSVIQLGYPLRLKAMHFINAPAVFEKVFAVFKPFFTEKLINRVKIYGTDNMEEFYKVIPRSLLPNEYGGEAGSIDKIAAEWKKKVESNKDWFLEDEKYVTDETKRRGRSKFANDTFGVDGTFRKLNID